MTSEHSRQALRPSAGGMMTVKFADEIARLKSTDEWKSADRHALSLVKDDALNVLLMVLKKGARFSKVERILPKPPDPDDAPIVLCAPPRFQNSGSKVGSHVKRAPASVPKIHHHGGFKSFACTAFGR